MVNLDQAQLLFQMIIAQHADKTWGEVRELLGVQVNQLDKNIKICESKCEKINESVVAVNYKKSIQYLISYGLYDLYCISDCDEIVKLSFDKVVSIVSFEDKI